MKLKLYGLYVTFPFAWQSSNSNEGYAYIEIFLTLSYKHLPFFTVATPNKSFNGLNLISVLIQALESETVGMQKYSALKYSVRNNESWKDL